MRHPQQLGDALAEYLSTLPPPHTQEHPMSTPNTDTLASLANRLAAAQARRDAITEPLDAEIEGLKGAIRAEVADSGPGTYEAGEYTLTLRANRRFDPARAADILPAEVVAAITTTSIDPKVARQKLPPETFEACMTERGNMTVVLK